MACLAPLIYLIYSLYQDLGANPEIDRQVLVRVAALDEVAAPRDEGIGPAAHRVLIAPEILDTERRRPMVVVAELHWHHAPVSFALVAVEHLGDDRIVAVGEYIGLDEHLVANGALYRIAAAVDLRPDRLDDDTRRRRPDFFARLIQA